MENLLPVTGNANSLLYADLQGSIAEDGSWYGGLGTGYRQIENNSHILGGYVFLDRNTSVKHNTFWVINPGIEMLFPTWDLRLNSYLVFNQHQEIRKFFPSTQGDYRFIHFQGHQQFEHKFALFENAGPGAEMEIGHTFPGLHNAKRWFCLR